jgi:hypothetical protein
MTRLTEEEQHSHGHLHTSTSTKLSPSLSSTSLLNGNPNPNNSADSTSKTRHSKLEGMQVNDVVSMLAETNVLDEQASLVHFLWIKLGPSFDTKLNDVSGVTVKVLMEELYTKACEARDWSWVRLSAGLLGKQLDELSKAVTHLLVRQKQITLGMPSKNEEAMTCPKTKEELKEIFNRSYGDDPNSYILAQELIVSLGSLVSEVVGTHNTNKPTRWIV